MILFFNPKIPGLGNAKSRDLGIENAVGYSGILGFGILGLQSYSYHTGPDLAAGWEARGPA